LSRKKIAKWLSGFYPPKPMTGHKAEAHKPTNDVESSPPKESATGNQIKNCWPKDLLEDLAEDEKTPISIVIEPIGQRKNEVEIGKTSLNTTPAQEPSREEIDVYIDPKQKSFDPTKLEGF
jgi:hypothetical protein